jgi:predicted secreted protein
VQVMPDEKKSAPEQEKPERIILNEKVGTPFTLRIWEDRTRGSRWVPTVDGSALKLIGDDYKRTIDIRVADTGMRTFEFLPLKPGSHEMMLEQRYGWKFTAEKRLFYTIEVSP